MRFMMAAAVGVWFSLWRWDRPWKRFTGFLWLLWHSFNHPRVDRSKFVGRMETCIHCPLFYAPLQTCGSPLDGERGELGCWCYLPVKNRLAGATCWLLDQGATGYGWKDDLL